MKLILDLDTGIDDALAIAYAAANKEVELIGITNCFGNVTVDIAVRNTLNVLDLIGREDVPVYRGAENAWAAEGYYKTSEHLYRIHGRNGIGNVELGEAKREKADMTAVDFLIEAANKYGEDLTLVTTAPLTNLADAIKKDKKAIEKIGKIVTMGGALTVEGNVTRFAEANIQKDPDAAKFIFESGKAAKALTDMSVYYYKNELDDEEIGGAMHDPLAVDAAIYPDVIKYMLPINLTVDTQGETKGRIIGDTDLLNVEKKNCFVCLDVDSEAFIKRFTQKIERLIASNQ